MMSYKTGLRGVCVVMSAKEVENERKRRGDKVGDEGGVSRG